MLETFQINTAVINRLEITQNTVFRKSKHSQNRLSGVDSQILHISNEATRVDAKANQKMGLPAG